MQVNLTERLETLAAEADHVELARRYAAADPFPHIVIDNVLPPDLLAAVLAEYPGPEAPLWYKFRAGTENKKLQSTNFSAIGPTLRAVMDFANAPPFLQFLEKVTGIPALLGDTEYQGGGLHQTLPGGHLSVHVDYNFHPTQKWDRRLNAILYLNPNWEDAWAGHLELWDKDNQRAVQRITPIANRMVVFATHETSWHGHPDPLVCPPGITRRSIATYYYTQGRPETELAPAHNTLFRARPGETFRETPREKLAKVARSLGLLGRGTD